ncbi:hypothetical protein E6C60_1817 [Paenibacillus algicola]|uniref:Uncharacterized protein n=1 Tax=Paenibacillus algicola TaxID=2565926 RepID=A0A4P8XIT5_9BACL|nr:hypothetical protein E6C60_1817 [Paenibacillus algicola]
MLEPPEAGFGAGFAAGCPDAFSAGLRTLAAPRLPAALEAFLAFTEADDLDAEA